MKKSVYGLRDASRKWWQKCNSELELMGCVKLKFDPALFLYFDVNNLLAGIICLHVDDKLGCGGNSDFIQNVWNKLDQRLVVGKTERDEVLRYVGMNTTQSPGVVHVDQKHYINRLESIGKEQLAEIVVNGYNDSTPVNEVGQSIFKSLL